MGSEQVRCPVCGTAKVTPQQREVGAAGLVWEGQKAPVYTEEDMERQWWTYLCEKGHSFSFETKAQGA